jgi:hypothetical protein
MACYGDSFLEDKQKILLAISEQPKLGFVIFQ